MRIVSQEYLSDEKLAAECEDCRNGHKNFMLSGAKRRFGSYAPAWTYEGQSFQFTLHTAATQGADVVAFASGRIKPVCDVEAAIVEIVGVLPEARGKQIGLKIHEHIMKHTGLALAAAHTQTPQGRDLWWRMLKHGKQMILTVAHAGIRYRVTRPTDLTALPFDLYDGGDATFLLAKNHFEKVAMIGEMAVSK